VPARSWSHLGPGLLFAAAAIGVSHLVQSTRAGAQFGLALVGFVVLANAIKYPAFRFGPEYAATTGESLLEGYRRQGRWAVLLYGGLTLATMFTVQAAVTVVTAGLAIAVFGLPFSAWVVSAALLALGGVVLGFGRYAWLDRYARVLVAVLAGSTLAATLMVLPRLPWATLMSPWHVGWSDAPFLAALFGWMPSAIDVSVWQSLWTLERAHVKGTKLDPDAARFDFHVGYLGTAALALCFVALGAGVLHRAEVAIPGSAVGFATTLIQTYGAVLGGWAEPVVGVSALAVMLSTTLTVLDGFPRAMQRCIDQFRRPSSVGSPTGFVGWVVLLALGALAIIRWAGNLRDLVDVATVLSFLTAPVLSWLNHRAMTAEHVPAPGRPGPWLRATSGVCIGLQALFAAAYLGLRFG
jgi:Mn2+/Fe2+ NRAMP family transporter